MKTIHIILLSAFLGAMTSCTMGTTTVKEPTQQEKVINYLRYMKDEAYRQSNAIQKKEFVEKFENDFYHMLDSIKLLTNWNGTITRINQRESGNTINLTFEIECPIEAKYGKLTLSCQYLLGKGKKDTDRVYQQVYAMSDGSPVVFDGFPRTKNDALYWMGDKDLRTSSPEIGFWVTDIAKGAVKDTISENLRKACMLAFDSVNLIKQSDSKEISMAEFNRLSAQISKENEAAKALLTDEEKDYLQALRAHAYLNYTY